MSQRAEISEKNEFYISKHRYYELKHFCLQYPEWKKKLVEIDYIHGVGTIRSDTNKVADPTSDYAIEREWYKKNIEMVRRTCRDVDASLSDYILRGVTFGLPYNALRSRYGIPCCKDVYYKLYREFFWLLDKRRKNFGS